MDQTDHFAEVFIRKNVVSRYDVVTSFESLQLTPFCLEKTSVKKMEFKGFRDVFSGLLVRTR